MDKSGFVTQRKLKYSFFEPKKGDKVVYKEVIVFLHGLGSSENFYFGIAQRLSEHYRCLLIDNEGAARSTLLREGLCIKDLAENAVRVVQDLGLANELLVFVGHSMSGMVVSHLAARCDLKIQRCVLLAPVHPRDELTTILTKRIAFIEKTNQMFDVANILSESAVGSRCSGVKKALIRELLMNQSVIGYTAHCRAICSESQQNEYYIQLYKESKVPTLLILGEEDEITPWKGCTQIIHENLQASKVISIPGCGHWTAIESESEVFSLIELFIK